MKSPRHEPMRPSAGFGFVGRILVLSLAMASSVHSASSSEGSVAGFSQQRDTAKATEQLNQRPPDAQEASCASVAAAQQQPRKSLADTNSKLSLNVQSLTSPQSASITDQASSPSSPSSLTPSPLPDTCEQFDWCTDRHGFEAIRWLHRQLDDDANGNVDIAESDEFLRDELQYENGYDRHKTFHGNDKQISVDELWLSWSKSEVHNWTVEETVEWLVSNVELPQYSEHFKKYAVNGSKLPRMTASPTFMVSLGIKDPIHRQKLSLKAMDVVLFGPPKHHNYIKDVVLVLSLVMAIGGCWFAFVQHKYSQVHIKKMLKDMESLQKAEEQLSRLQNELHKARHDQEQVISEKETLKKRLEDEIVAQEVKENDLLNHNNRELSMSPDDETKLNQLRKELSETREQLSIAERQLEDANNSWTPPRALQKWLIITHELEMKNFTAKRHSAELQLATAKDCCEKLRRKRSTFMGSFRVAHGKVIDDVDNTILLARQALSEVTKDLEERLNRWRQIEQLCCFIIVNGTQSPTGLTHSLSELSLASTTATITSSR